MNINELMQRLVEAVPLNCCGYSSFYLVAEPEGGPPGSEPQLL